MKSGEILGPLIVERLDRDGRGIVQEGGFTLLVDGACPGDEVRVKVSHVSRHKPLAWCQCAPVAELDHLMRRWRLDPAPGHFAIGCLFVAPDSRGRGVARALLGAVLAELRLLGAKRVSAIPRRGRDLPPGEAWTGPEALYKEFGFRLLREEGAMSLYGLELKPDISAEA